MICTRLIWSGFAAFSSQVFCPSQRQQRGAEEEVSAHQHRVLRVLLMTDHHTAVAWPPGGDVRYWTGWDFRHAKPGNNGTVSPEKAGTQRRRQHRVGSVGPGHLEIQVQSYVQARLTQPKGSVEPPGETRSFPGMLSSFDGFLWKFCRVAEDLERVEKTCVCRVHVPGCFTGSHMKVDGAAASELAEVQNIHSVRKN